MYYGPSSVETHLLSCLPHESSKAFIITGKSLATKTSLISQVETLLGQSHHAGTFSEIKQHAPVAQLDEATDLVSKDPKIDTIISIGGGSPIDSAKAISYRFHGKHGKFLYHIAIPTTLSAGECTMTAGYTSAESQKVAVATPELVPHVIIYDAKFGSQTPPRLWLSTGIRALDHAVELLYNRTVTEMPGRTLALAAIEALFTYLPRCKEDMSNEEFITRVQLAAFSSLNPLGLNRKGDLGLSHAMGHALGSPYGIPHGITSCITLPGVVRYMAEKPEAAEQLARVMPFIGLKRSHDDKKDAVEVGNAVERLVNSLGLESRLSEYSVGEDQVPVIARTSTKQEAGPVFDAAKKIAQSKL